MCCWVVLSISRTRQFLACCMLKLPKKQKSESRLIRLQWSYTCSLFVKRSIFNNNSLKSTNVVCCIDLRQVDCCSLKNVEWSLTSKEQLLKCFNRLSLCWTGVSLIIAERIFGAERGYCVRHLFFLPSKSVTLQMVVHQNIKHRRKKDNDQFQ